MLSPAYTDIKRLRSHGKCGDAMALLRANPPSTDHEAFEAAVCLFVCGDLASSANVCRTWRWQARWARGIAAALAEMLQGGDAASALGSSRAAVEERTAPCDALAIHLMVLKTAGTREEAAAFIDSRLQDPPPGETLLLTVLAETAADLRDWRLAYRSAAGVLSIDPDDYRALLVQSTANLKDGNVHEALGCAIRANLVQPGAAPPILRMMECRNKLGDYYGVLAAFEKLDAKDAAPAAVRVELGTAFLGLENRERAIAELETALEAEPSVPALRLLLRVHLHSANTAALEALAARQRSTVERDVECLSLLALDRLRNGDVDGAAGRLEQSMAVAVESRMAAAGVPWPVPEPRVRHDYEQLQLLDQRGRLDDAGRNALGVLARYCNGAGDPEQSFAPEGEAGAALKDVLVGVHYRPDPAFEGPALGANDYAAIEDRYLAERVVVIDNFLAPQALAALRRFSEEATVWKLHYGRGYMGALLGQGFSPRVLLVLADELRRAMPRVIGDQPLLQAWGFKYDQRLQGINMHADFARVNVNFWITPDEACLDPTTGGMVVYDLPAPKHWTFADYNSDSEKLAAYLRVHDAQPKRVPHRANRCVLFDSSLIHITDEMHFKPGYENRRVNVTMLYGKARTVG